MRWAAYRVARRWRRSTLWRSAFCFAKSFAQPAWMQAQQRQLINQGCTINTIFCNFKRNPDFNENYSHLRFLCYAARSLSLMLCAIESFFAASALPVQQALRKPVFYSPTAGNPRKTACASAVAATRICSCFDASLARLDSLAKCGVFLGPCD